METSSIDVFATNISRQQAQYIDLDIPLTKCALLAQNKNKQREKNYTWLSRTINKTLDTECQLITRSY